MDFSPSRDDDRPRISPSASRDSIEPRRRAEAAELPRVRRLRTVYRASGRWCAFSALGVAQSTFKRVIHKLLTSLSQTKIIYSRTPKRFMLECFVAWAVTFWLVF